MKCFEQLVKTHICSFIPDTLDPLQLASRPNRATGDAYVRVLFIDYSSAFNTIIPSKLFTKLVDLGLEASICSWIFDFLTAGPHELRVGSHSSSLTLNAGALHMLSPLLYTLFNADCVAEHSTNVLIKFVDDTTIMGLITDNDERAYREEVKALTSWCQDNSLFLNVSETKEMIVD